MPLPLGTKLHVMDTTTFVSLESIIGTSSMIGTWHQHHSLMPCMPLSPCCTHDL